MSSLAPKSKSDGVEFVDVQEMHLLHPKTFSAPSRADLRRIRVGSVVKVACNQERFWTEVVRVRGREVTATVANILVCKQPFNNGDLIHFQKRHVFDIMEEEQQ